MLAGGWLSAVLASRKERRSRDASGGVRRVRYGRVTAAAADWFSRGITRHKTARLLAWPCQSWKAFMQAARADAIDSPGRFPAMTDLLLTGRL